MTEEQYDEIIIKKLILNEEQLENSETKKYFEMQ